MSVLKIDGKDEAVSPVVGVMLMLVVTIIVAAVVAAFAGGVATETNAASNVVIKLDNYEMKTIGYNGYGPYEFCYFYNSSTTNEDLKATKSFNYAPYSMTFMHSGGEPLDVNELKVSITYNGATFSTPITSILTDKTKWSVGEKLILTIKEDDIEGLTEGLLFGLSQCDMTVYDDGGKYPTTFDWSLTDGTGYVIAKGIAETQYEASKTHIHKYTSASKCSCGKECEHTSKYNKGEGACFYCGATP